MRENRVTQCYNADVKPLSLQYATSANEHVIANVPLNGYGLAIFQFVNIHSYFIQDGENED